MHNKILISLCIILFLNFIYELKNKILIERVLKLKINKLISKTKTNKHNLSEVESFSKKLYHVNKNKFCKNSIKNL